MLLLGGVCALVIAIDTVRHPQHMAIMDTVWPVTALIGTVGVLWAYRRYGRLATREAIERAKERQQFAIFRPAFGAIAPVDSPEFWFAMPLAMFGGFLTAYPPTRG